MGVGWRREGRLDFGASGGALNTRILALMMALAGLVTLTPQPAAAGDGDPVYQEEDRDRFGPPAMVPQNFLPENSRVAETIGSKPNLFLSFDDGDSSLTPVLLDVLAEYPEVGVTFFVNCKEPISGVMHADHRRRPRHREPHLPPLVVDGDELVRTMEPVRTAQPVRE